MLKQGTDHRSNSGFTLLELMVIILMTTMIALTSIASFRAGEKRKRADIAADTVTSALRVAQEYAFAGKNTNNPNSSCRVPQYYFVRFTYSSSLSLRARNNCGSDDTIETYSLPQNTRVQASGLKLDGTAVANNLVLAFYPPFGAARASANGAAHASFTSAAITVETSDGQVSKVTTVDGVSGRID